MASITSTPSKSDIARIKDLVISDLEPTIFTPFSEIVQARLKEARDLLASMGARRNIADIDSRLISAKVLSLTDTSLRNRHIEHVAEYEKIQPLVDTLQQLSDVMQEAITGLHQRDWEGVKNNVKNSDVKSTREISEAVLKHFQMIQDKKVEVDQTNAFLLERMKNLYAYIRDANIVIFPQTAGLGSYISKYLSSLPTAEQLKAIMVKEAAEALASPKAKDEGKESGSIRAQVSSPPSSLVTESVAQSGSPRADADKEKT